MILTTTQQIEGHSIREYKAPIEREEKSLEQIRQCLPEDWGGGYGNVTICCTMENQRRTDERLPIFREFQDSHD